MAIERVKVVQEVKIETRKVKKGKAQDSGRGNQTFVCWYITVNNTNYTLCLNGWKSGLKHKHDHNYGDYVVIEGNKYYLRY